MKMKKKQPSKRKKAVNPFIAYGKRVMARLVREKRISDGTSTPAKSHPESSKRGKVSVFRKRDAMTKPSYEELRIAKRTKVSRITDSGVSDMGKTTLQEIRNCSFTCKCGISYELFQDGNRIGLKPVRFETDFTKLQFQYSKDGGRKWSKPRKGK